MQTSGKTSAIRTGGPRQEWGAKRRKGEAKNGRRNRRYAAIRDARNGGATRGGHGR